MNYSKIKYIGLALALVTFSACSAKKSADSSNQNNGTGLNIQGTTSWLIDVMIPSTYAFDLSDELASTCPKGFYASPIKSATDKKEMEAADAPATIDGEIPAVISDTIENSSSVCPNSKTTCTSESGTCAFLYSISETEGKNLICTVPVDKLNHYEFQFAENPGITAGQIVITSPAASTVVIPNSCMAERGEEKKKPIIEKGQGYECLPDPVAYREITFEVTDNQIIADADPDATLESGFNAAILQTPSETLKEKYRKAKEDSIKEIKDQYGEKIDFNDETNISTFANAKMAEDRLNSIVMSSEGLDLEKIKKEIEAKMVLDKVDNPEKLAHLEKTNTMIKDMAGRKAAELPEGDAAKEKLAAIQDELNSKVN